MFGLTLIAYGLV